MLLTEQEKIKNLKIQIDNLENSAKEELLSEEDVITAINIAMAKIEKYKKEYVDKCHNWNERDKNPRIKSRRGEKITYYMTHVKTGKIIKQISASSLDSLYEKLYDFYAADTSLEISKNITVKELFEIYIQLRWKDVHEYHTLSSKTVYTSEADWNRFFANSDFIHQKVIGISQRQVFNEYKRLTGPGLLTKKTFTKAKGLLDGIFDLAIESGIIEYNPSRIISIRRLKFKLEESKSSNVYTTKERDAILKYLKNQKNQTVYTLAIQLAFCFCLRIGELRALTWNDYDEKSKTLLIWHQIVDQEKNGKMRCATDVPFTKTNTLEGRRLLFVSDEAARILSELRKINGNKKYILNSSGKMPISTNRFNGSLKSFCEKAGVRYLSSHKIRFYGATELFNAGVDPEQIRRIMGHTTLAMTEHYNRTDGNILVDKEIWDKIFGDKK